MKLIDNIERLRYELNELILIEEDLCIYSVIKLSEELDRLIAEYYKNLDSKNKVANTNSEYIHKKSKMVVLEGINNGKRTSRDKKRWTKSPYR